jgi:CheY-like chemotaxis protein
MPNSKTVVAVLSDLMFRVKIEDAAKRAGLRTVFVQSQGDALAWAREHPAMMILDLNCPSTEPLETIAKLKSDDATKAISLVGYVSHVQVDLKQAAQEQGCDVVVARSALSQNLPTILRRYSEGKNDAPQSDMI